MPPSGAGAHPGLERWWDLERRELAREDLRSVRGSLFLAAVGRDVRHREALGGAFRAEVEARLPLDHERDARQPRQQTRLHDRAPVWPDRDRHRGRRRERGGPAPGRDQDAIRADVAARGAHPGDAFAFAKKRLDRDALAEGRPVELRGGREAGERGERVSVPVACAESTAEDIVGADSGNELGDLHAIHHANRGAHALVEVHRLAELRDTLLRVGEEEVAPLLEVVARAGAVFEVPPERRRELRHTDVELVDELMTDAAEAAFRRPRAELIALEDQHIPLAAIAEKERGGRTDDATADDDRRGRPRKVGQSSTSSKRNLPSVSEMRPNRGRSCVKPTIHRSSIARRRISFFAASVSSGKRSNAGIHGSGRWWRSGMKSLEKKSVVSRSVTRTVCVPRVCPWTRSSRTPGMISTDSSMRSSLPAASRGA